MSFQYSLFRVLMVNDESSNRREGNFLSLIHISEPTRLL